MNIDHLKTTGYLHSASDIFDPDVTEGTLRSFLQDKDASSVTAEKKNAGRCPDCVLDKSSSTEQVTLKETVLASGSTLQFEWWCTAQKHRDNRPNIKIKSTSL